MSQSGRGADSSNEVSDLGRRIQKLTKINSALMQRVERSMDQQANAFSLFQTAIGLENQIRARTEELKSALSNLERANEELKGARDTAERANRFKTRFFTAVGHDLLQPLHAARLSLAELADVEQAAEGQRLTASISRALTTIEDLLTSILDISKLDAGVFVPSFQPVALGDMFEQLAASIEPIVKKKGLTFKWQPTEALIHSDPQMLRRVLQNLLANATNYTSKGGLLLAARRRGQMMRIEVWDTGPGISFTERERIFEEFQRGAASELAGRTGFGLGLSIVKRMSEALSHPLEFCSRVGHGTMFSISADYAGSTSMESRTTAETFPAPAQGLQGLQGLPLIVIDNDLSVLEAMQSLLNRWGCDVRLARNQDDVAEILGDATFRPAIILADYHLDHGVSGLEVVATIRRSLDQNLPAILITADRTPGTANAATEKGLEVMHKPVRPAELRALIQHLLR
jgi:two-component system, sensor histidine kinase